MLYIDKQTGQFLKRVALIVALKGGHVEHLNAVFHVTTSQQ